jgi:hypothetical protein
MSVRSCAGHGLPAGGRQVEERSLLQPARRAQGRQLSEAVPADGIGLQTELLERPQRGQTGRTDRRLGGLGRPQGCRGVIAVGARPGENAIAQKPLADGKPVGGFECGERAREHARQIRHHARVLAALAREQKRE